MVLTWVDYLVIGGYLLAITAFGSYFARFQKTTRDYFLTGQSVPWWAICFTIVATETSTLTFISVPAMAYGGDMTFLQLVFGYVIGRVLVSVLFIPAYFRGDLVTSYELLQRRFGPSVKNLAALIFLITRSLADGIRLFATALVISVVTHVPVTWAVVVIGAAMIVYTVRGGASAVIWTDVVQLFVYIAGAAVVFVSLLALIPGGWPEVVRAGSAAGKFRVFDFSTTLARPCATNSRIWRSMPVRLAIGSTVPGWPGLTSQYSWPSSASSFFARPKSVTFGVPSFVSRMLAGLRSRWMMSCSCAACIACARISTIRPGWKRRSTPMARWML